MQDMGIAFGPVPSRRLGRSLGINNIPPKICTFSCVYCQLGRTHRMEIDRRPWYDPQFVYETVSEKVAQADAAGEHIDFLTFVPDGEATLDMNLGREIELLRQLDIPVAVITNASLIWRPDVREELGQADWVSLKVDAVTDAIWRRIDRPHADLSLSAILQGAREFASSFRGTLATETMLVNGINTDDSTLRETAGSIAALQPATAYVAVPTRPPAEAWVRPPVEVAMHQAFQLFKEKIANVELLIGYEGNAFTTGGEVEKDLLAITAVHPMREEAVGALLARAGADWSIVHKLCAENQLVAIAYMGQSYFVRKLHPLR